MPTDSLVHTDDHSQLTEAINRIVWRDRGNTRFPAQVIWGSTGTAYALILAGPSTNHLVALLGATSPTATPSAANAVLLVQDAAVSVGSGKELRFYTAAGADPVNLIHSSDAGWLKTANALQILGGLSVGTQTTPGTGQGAFSIATGSPPFVIASTTKVNNLNVDMVDDAHASATPTASTIPIADGSGDLALGWIPALTVVALNYVAAADLLNGTVLTANTWTDLSANQNFSVTDAASTILIAVRGNCGIGNRATQAESGSRLVIDSAGTPQNIRLGGNWLGNGTSDYSNALGGTDVVAVTGLSVATHTVKTQIMCSQAGTAYCRPSSVPDFENLAITVLELKR